MQNYTKLPDHLLKQAEQLNASQQIPISFEQSPPEFHIPFLAIGAGAVFVIGISVFGGYSFFIAPRVQAHSVLKSLKPRVTAVYQAVSNVHKSMKSIEKKATADITIDPSHSAMNHGSAIHSQLSRIEADAYVLGTSTIGVDSKGLLEGAVQGLQQHSNALLQQLSVSPDVAGAETAFQQQYITAIKDLKRTAVQSIDLIISAQSTVYNLQTSSPNTPSLSEVNETMGKPALIKDQSDPYFTEALKISRYYERITDLVLTMNTKVRSFSISLASAANSMAALGQENMSTEGAKITMTQSQQYLLEAERHAKEITTLLNTLKTISPDELPAHAEEFHKHNIAVLNSLNNYFEGTTTVMHGFIDSTNSILTKISTGIIGPADLILYQQTIEKGMRQATVLDAAFIAEFQSILGEEKAITDSFWENTTILRDGDLLLADINSYNLSIEALATKNSVIFFTD